MEVSLIQATQYPIETIARIASICYDSNPKHPERLVKRLYTSGHHSVFEHIWFTFKIEGISRACSHQLVRHRMCAFTQRSQRYCSEEGFEHVTPPKMFSSRDALYWYSQAMDKAADAYLILTNLEDVPNEDARFVLPNACETSLYMSCNLRELIHICNERLCSRAQWEIRELVERMRQLVDEDLRWMLVPKCQSKLMICNNPCGRARKYEEE